MYSWHEGTLIVTSNILRYLLMCHTDQLLDLLPEEVDEIEVLDLNSPLNANCSFS